MDLNRKTRRELARAQPAADLVATRQAASPFVYVGILGGGCVRLWPHEARAFVASLLDLVDQAEDAGQEIPPCAP